MSWELSRRPIDYAEEAGNFIIHYSRDRHPVLVEILGASAFLKQSDKLLKIKMRQLRF